MDKIIFGKLNYNVKSTQFGYNGNFYQDCADVVIEFCRKNDIEHHIKCGTQKKDNKKTEKIFVKNSIESLNLNIKQPTLSFDF